MKDIYLQLGSKIREVRKKQNMTLEDLSDRAELDWSFVARIERGKAVPSIMSIVKISKALNMSLRELFSLDKKSIPQQDKLLERELLSIIEKLKTPDRFRIIKILKLILATPSKTFKISKK